MGAKSLRSFFEASCGEQEIVFTVPRALLPPRYQKEEAKGDLVVVFDRDFTVHLRWSSLRMGPWRNVSAGEVRRLAKDVLTNLRKFGRDFREFERFVSDYAEAPFEDPIHCEQEESEEVVGAEVLIVPNASEKRAGPPASCAGGEPPLVSWEF